MKIGNYQTQIFRALWHRVKRTRSHPPGAFWYPLDDWLYGEDMLKEMKKRKFEL